MSTLTQQGDELANGLELLAAGIPMTLLFDIATGPHSVEIYMDEPAELDWIEPHGFRALAG